MTEKPDPNE